MTRNWGHRPFPLPDHKHILIIGNSHVRQTFVSLLCLYQEMIEQVSIQNTWTKTFHFRNSGTLVTIANTPHVYRTDWAPYIQSLLGYPFTRLDAILIGQNNDFTSEMLNYTQLIPEVVDFTKIIAPSMENMTMIYPGPIIGLTMFGIDGQSEVIESTKRAAEYWKSHSNRTSIFYINGRKHVDAIRFECGSNKKYEMGTCRNHVPNFHRCVGNHAGGHPDLLAWDVN